MSAPCPVYAGSDPCRLPDGHAGDHETSWDNHVVMQWRGTEEWSHRVPRTGAAE